VQLLAISLNKLPLPELKKGSAEILYYDGLQFADSKRRERPLPPTDSSGFKSEATGAPKDRSPIANINRDGALISFKEMPIALVEANHHAGKIACAKIGGLSVERTSLINHLQVR